MVPIRCSVRGFKIWLVCAVGCLVLPLHSIPVHAVECGVNTPDYIARRSLVIGPNTRITKVYVSGTKLREEETANDGRQTVALWLPDQGFNYILNVAANEAVRLPLPPKPAQSKQTRRTVDRRADGTTIQHLQLLSEGEWKDISTTTCRADSVMLNRAFTFIDPEGHLLNGNLTQSDISVTPLPKTLFEVPPSIKVRDPLAQPADRQ